MAREISQLLVVSNPKPLVNCLHQGLHIFAGFELYHSKSTLPLDPCIQTRDDLAACGQNVSPEAPGGRRHTGIDSNCATD
jgi:hypothetical protein